MIVKYVKERGYEGNGADPLLTLNKEYIVFRVEFRTDGHPTSIAVPIDRDGSLGKFYINCFSVVDSRVPLEWNLTTRPATFCLEPIEFSDTFWDDYGDDDEAAEQVFFDVHKKLKTFHEEGNKLGQPFI
ncbi:hypothetical protein GCM10008107_19980 [Psychrosphaera saromensis]|uniref:Uncharacterized protein n=1 Tax=Psychrosphaera saromensis TaxID=716813 RepID=A0A2S7USH0_9GAMM|nr:hypothetical protein [Psychrosphaera saromensis]PQJ52699.1 hypothetical protein BTO11_02875 [Psychrosphaera saromensis]GHB70542.1 hypothetical protein GCM10008107_19980 [Psychrosphaera saromensis]GLQ13184.1 hypothetical protein GCM10007917_06390 [Psychrosphaera saromensis]